MMEQRDELIFLPLGGVGEIGMNLGLYGFGREKHHKWIMVDLGITFAGQTCPGIDRIMAETHFIEENRDDLLAIVLTHAHEDHYGAVLDLWPRLKAPVYATAFAIALLRAKMMEEHIDLPIIFYEIPPNGRFNVGPFDIECVAMPHSIPESNGLAIRTPMGMVYHSGDWKIDHTPQISNGIDASKLEALGQEGCHALICDSTNAMCEGVSSSEGDVFHVLKKVIAEASGLVVITAFASNVARLRSAVLAAANCGRQVILVGRAMHRVISAAKEGGYLDDVPAFIDEDRFKSLPRGQLVVLITGSQGEERAGLTRAANDDHPYISFAEGDTVIFSARAIPGNEKVVGQLQNMLVDLGVKVITEKDDLVHVSGHPRRGELMCMYEWLKPRCVVPIHGESRHIEAHAKLAESKKIPAVRIRNGDMLRLLPAPIDKIAKIPSGRLYKDGRFLVGEMDKGMQERRQLSYAGCIVASLVIDRNKRRMVDSDVSVFGIPDAINEEGDCTHDIVDRCIDEVLNTLSKKQIVDSDIFSRAVRRAIRAKMYSFWGKRPICKVMVSQC